MTDTTVSRFGHTELADMPEDLQQRLAAVTEKSRFMPNVFNAPRTPAGRSWSCTAAPILVHRSGAIRRHRTEQR